MDVVGGTEQAVGTGMHGNIRSACFDHKAQLRREIISGAKQAIRARDQRIVRLQRNEDEVLTTLGDKVQAVIKELAEEREPRIKRNRQPEVRLDIRDELDGPVVGRSEHA